MSNYEFASDLGLRVKRAKKLKNLMRNEGRYPLEPYSYDIEGSYQYPFFEGVDNSEELNSETYIKDTLDAITYLKFSSSNDLPAIMVDWGGGWIAQSVRRLATTVNGIFIVSSLAKVPEAHDRVEFVQADASELVKQIITLPDGRTVPLQGNIDLIHERRMLQHNLLADADLLIMAKALSPYGVMMLNSTESYLESLISQQFMPLEESRKKIIDLGKQNIQRVGLTRVPIICEKKPVYEIYVKPHAPKLNKF